MLHFDRRLWRNFEWVMLGAVLIVTLLGLINLYSSSFTRVSYGTSVFIKQTYYCLMGFGIISIIILLDYKILSRWSYPLYAMIISMLLATLIIGDTVAGAQRWLDLGFFRLQPSEPAKLILIITLARLYSRKDTSAGLSFKELLIPIGLTGIPFVLITKQPDLGTAILLGLIFVSMILFVKLKWSTLAALTGIALFLAPLAWRFALRPYQRQRILTLFNAGNDPLGTGFHIAQSKIAVGSGSIFGKGYLQGTQAHLDFLPERHTDFAFSVWAEEWGFIGSIFFLACYFFIVLWGMNIARSARDKFGVLLAFGIASLFFWQGFVNIGMVLGLLPVVGMPLPLFSYGGSSLVTMLAGIGILMSIRMRRFMT